MDLQHLRYYVEIVKSKSFTKAAENLVVTQPMLTRVIKQLEDELGVKLIERTSKYFCTTDVGEVLYQQASELLHRFMDIYHNIDDIKSASSGEVRLSTPGVLLDMYFPKLLKNFYQINPQINISIVEEGSKLTVESVMNESADLGFVMVPVSHMSNLICDIIIQSECKLVVSKYHPLSQRESVQIKELEYERFITFSDTSTLHDSFINLCQTEGFTPRIAYKSLMPNFVFEMVSHQLCVAIQPIPIINRYLSPDLVAIPFNPKISWDIAVIRKKERYQSYASSQLLAFVVEYFHTLEL